MQDPNLSQPREAGDESALPRDRKTTLGYNADILEITDPASDFSCLWNYPILFPAYVVMIASGLYPWIEGRPRVTPCTVLPSLPLLIFSASKT